MDIRLRFTALLLAGAASVAGTALAAEPAPAPGAVVHVVDCADRSLPRQRDVGAWAGQADPGQAYATRQRLMAEIGRACKRARSDQVQVVLQARDARAPSPAAHYATTAGTAR